MSVPAKRKFVIGIDEVGRGALAGPVVVVAALVPARRSAWLRPSAVRMRGALRDSKKLTAAQRESWSKHLRGIPGVRFSTARVYPRGIERLNISGAANRAAARALAALIKEYGNAASGADIFLDGGLFVGSRAAQEELFPRARTMAKADEKVPAVAAASIVAKVTRDRFMGKLARRWPEYAFEVHKGYGTKKHRAALAKAGPCEAHRLTFLAKRPSIS